MDVYSENVYSVTTIKSPLTESYLVIFLGTTASDVNFQVFLLDGIHRWNQSRQRDMELDQTGSSPLSYDGRLVQSVNQLARTVLDKDICPGFSLPGKYTGTINSFII